MDAPKPAVNGLTPVAAAEGFAAPLASGPKPSKVRPTRAAGPTALALGRARRLRQSGRAVALCSFGLYAAGLVAAAIALDYWHPTRDTGGVVKLAQLRHLMDREPGRPLAVMLGSSRTYNMFQARRLEGLSGPDGKALLAYNFGVPTYGLIHEYLLLCKMLEQGIRPSLLLVEVVPPLMGEPRQGMISEEEWTLSYWLNLRELLTMRPYFAAPLRRARIWLQGRLGPWSTLRFWLIKPVLDFFADHRGLSWDDMRDERGFKLPDWPTQAECARRLEETRKEFSESLQQFRLGKGSAQALRDLLDRCRREKIPVVLVVSPESSQFRSLYAAEGLAAVDRLLEEVRQTYGARILDARTWVADKDFSDGHHVLANGAETFTTRLIEELRPILREPGKPYEPNPLGLAFPGAN
jgi:hypothetical protein